MKKIFILFSFLITSLLLNANIDVGQRFILTLPRTFDQSKLEAWMEKTKPAGVMLVPFHFQNKNQTKELTSMLQQIARKLNMPPLIITADWEGGIVSRPSEVGGFVSVPAPHSLPHAGRSASFFAATMIGQQLRQVGVNVDFAPSLDLYSKNNFILATRCFSKNPDKTGEMGLAFARGLLSEGVQPVIKHFPGLGNGGADTHFNSVNLNLTNEEFENNLKPFVFLLTQKINLIMCTHAQCEQFGGEPVTLSKKAADFILSKNPNAILITDDFCMQAVRNFGSLLDISCKSLAAGYHLIILTGSEEEQQSFIADLQQKFNSNFTQAEQSTFAHKIEQVIKFKEALVFNEKSFTNVDTEAFSIQLANDAISCKKQKRNLENKHCFLISVDLPKIREAEKWFIFENKSYLAHVLEQQTVSFEEQILNPISSQSIEQLAQLKERFDEFDEIIIQTFFYGGGKWNDVQKAWLNALMDCQHKLTVISLGHPLESQILPDVSFIKVGSFQKPLLNVVANKLKKKPLKTGSDRLVENLDRYLKNKKIGLLCHKASVVSHGSIHFALTLSAHEVRVSKGRKTLTTSDLVDNKQAFLPDYLAEWASQQNDETKLAALFSPEHGLQGTRQACDLIDSSKNSQWGCPVYSLHGANKKPTAEMLSGLDLILIDLQDVGVRCFTYLSTMKYMLQAAAAKEIPVIVLDRPNPLNFLKPGGPLLTKGFESLVGAVDQPFITGKTIGQIAAEINAKIGATLTILSCENLESTADYFQNNLMPPSPNLSSLKAIYAYPATVFIEGTNYTEGRGTAHPFEQIGAPWVDAQSLANALNEKQLAGVYFEPVSFIPKSITGVADKPKHKNKICNGVFIHLHDLTKYDPVKTGLVILTEMFKLYPEKSEWLKWGKQYGIDLLVGNDSWRNKINQALYKI